jgi:uncharacterized protein (TIGR02118 family)
MVKLTALQKRPEGVTREEFHRWWLDEHTPLAKRFPRLRKYVVSLSIDSPFGEPAYDGFAELWFDSLEDLEYALAAPESAPALEDRRKHVKEMVRLVTVEHEIV